MERLKRLRKSAQAETDGPTPATGSSKAAATPAGVKKTRKPATGGRGKKRKAAVNANDAGMGSLTSPLCLWLTLRQRTRLSRWKPVPMKATILPAPRSASTSPPSTLPAMSARDLSLDLSLRIWLRRGLTVRLPPRYCRYMSGRGIGLLSGIFDGSKAVLCAFFTFAA